MKAILIARDARDCSELPPVDGTRQQIRVESSPGTRLHLSIKRSGVIIRGFVVDQVTDGYRSNEKDRVR